VGSGASNLAQATPQALARVQALVAGLPDDVRSLLGSVAGTVQAAGASVGQRLLITTSAVVAGLPAPARETFNGVVQTVEAALPGLPNSGQAADLAAAAAPDPSPSAAPALSSAASVLSAAAPELSASVAAGPSATLSSSGLTATLANILRPKVLPAAAGPLPAAAEADTAIPPATAPELAPLLGNASDASSAFQVLGCDASCVDLDRAIVFACTKGACMQASDTLC
jgi:hypothetical protein